MSMKATSLRLLVLAWIALVGAGMLLLTAYKGTPGKLLPSPVRWPEESTIPRDPAQPTLVVFVHPRCPCSRATIGELDELMTYAQGKVKAHVVFIQPAGTPDEWVETDRWSAAAQIPGVDVRRDRGGVESARFHAHTSGEALLYSASGELQYEGGMTIARGHAGDNPGCRSILALLNGEVAPVIKAPVYGCSMFGPKQEKEETTCKK